MNLTHILVLKQCPKPITVSNRNDLVNFARSCFYTSRAMPMIHTFIRPTLHTSTWQTIENEATYLLVFILQSLICKHKKTKCNELTPFDVVPTSNFLVIKHYPCVLKQKMPQQSGLHSCTSKRLHK